jgi:hypothetical protein
VALRLYLERFFVCDRVSSRERHCFEARVAADAPFQMTGAGHFGHLLEVFEGVFRRLGQGVEDRLLVDRAERGDQAAVAAACGVRERQFTFGEHRDHVVELFGAGRFAAFRIFAAATTSSRSGTGAPRGLSTRADPRVTAAA